MVPDGSLSNGAEIVSPVLTDNENAWIDKKKTQVGYEIPFTRYFYKYVAPEKTDDILVRIRQNESDIRDSLKRLFEEDK